MVRVLTEGRVTEPSYLAALARHFRQTVTIDLDRTSGGKTPLALVERAAGQVRRNRKRRRKDGGPDFDEIWCVYDIDEHDNIVEAAHLAEREGIGIAVSDPCFELWLILHVADQTAWVSRADAQQRARDLGITDGKRLRDAPSLAAEWEPASERAEALAAQHERDDKPPTSNPSSTVSSLARSIAG